MLKTALIAAAAASVLVLGVPTADAKSGHSHGGKGHHSQGHHSGGDHHSYGHKDYGHKGYSHYGYGNYVRPYVARPWFGYSYYPRCTYQPRKVRVTAWRWGRPYYTWAWRKVRVCY